LGCCCCRCVRRICRSIYLRPDGQHETSG
jgi:hypothetical protein